MRFNKHSVVVAGLVMGALATVVLAQQRVTTRPLALKPEQAAELQPIRTMVGQGRSVGEIQTAWRNFLQKSKDVDVKAAVAHVLEDKKAEARRTMEELCQRVRDDEQLANIDLQNMLQKQQQTLQTISNISKMMHDTAMSVIRKIG